MSLEDRERLPCVWGHHVPEPVNAHLGRGGYLICNRHESDPERPPRSKTSDKTPHRTANRSSTNSLADAILEALADGEPATFNAIAVRAWGKSADTLCGTKAEEELWQLVKAGEVQERYEGSDGLGWLWFRLAPWRALTAAAIAELEHGEAVSITMPDDITKSYNLWHNKTRRRFEVDKAAAAFSYAQVLTWGASVVHYRAARSARTDARPAAQLTLFGVAA